MLTNFLGVLPILTPPLCVPAFIMCSKSNPLVVFALDLCSMNNLLFRFPTGSFFSPFNIFNPFIFHFGFPEYLMILYCLYIFVYESVLAKGGFLCLS
jgi:hypothetical protein